jgi:initiation factor 1A
MPKNLKGGKQFKRKAKEGDVDLSAFTIDRQEGQQIARAVKLLGNRNILCYCNDNKMRVSHICGKMRGRVFVDVGDVVLISLRDFELGSSKKSEDLTGDIIAKYPYESLTRLKKEDGINPKLFMQLEILDGARLANAIASGFNPKAIAGLGVDVLVLGGTKAGMSPTEALVVFNKSLGRRLDGRLKQAGQLPSKGRFYAAPWIGMLESGAFVSRAAHANQMAQRLAALMPFRIVHPVQANGLFVEMSDEQHRALIATGLQVYRVADGSVRFMCSWATTPEAVDGLGEMLRAVV